MDDVGIRELNQQTSKVLRRVVATGESVTITDHGRKVAMLVPIAPTTLQQLIDTGQVEEGAADVRQVKRVRIDRPSREVLAELGRDLL